jgi:hypothetical protein
MFKWLDSKYPNWQTTVGGLFTAVMIGFYDAYVNGRLHKSTIGVVLGVILMGYFAKVRSVTGGSVAQTPEAVTRAEVVAPQVQPPSIPTGKLPAWLLIIGLVGAFGVSSCHRVNHVTNLPPGVNEQEVKDWYAATGALSVIADNTKAATDIAIDLNHQGMFHDGPAYNTTLTVLARISQGGIHASNMLRAMPEHFDANARLQLSAFADDALAQAQKAVDEGMGGVGDQSGRQKLTDMLRGIQSALRIIALFQSSQYDNDPRAVTLRKAAILGPYVYTGPIFYTF